MDLLLERSLKIGSPRGTEAGPARRPWWIPTFLGRVPPEVDSHMLDVLGAVAFALLFEEYDIAMLTSALRQISEDLQMQQDRLGLYLGIIRLGAIPAFFVIPFADRLGRRRVFIFATMVMGLLTFATAFTQGAAGFVVCQAMTRTFFVTGSAVAFVIVTEEFPAEHRGWGMGMLAALGAVGHGLAAATYSQIDRLPYGWRALYIMGLVPVLLVRFFQRHVPETERFAQQYALHSPVNNAEARGLCSGLGPLKTLAFSQPARALSIALTGFMLALATLPSFQFSGFFAQKEHGWSPAQYSLLVMGAGTIGVIANIHLGRLGDRHGRKIVGFMLLLEFPLAVALFYKGPSWCLYLAFCCMVFGAMGGRVILRGLAAELFPTAYRGAASGMFSVVETLGGASGLFLLNWYGVEEVSDLAHIITALASSVVLAGLILFSFPETSQRELEDICR
eukprot:TRINITY_DN17451_c0_g1_i1.p1 TRINITY_DN17451_c0_g1~~TRINITY_DN17451_c0_g1_i1.p1  ORF type:complete len:449 (+),score=65.96 TRINITY_DN17451_c0_g1_i1:59-1405(+)